MSKLFARACVVALTLVGIAHGQGSLSIEAEGLLAPGEDVTVTVTDLSRAGEPVVVQMNDGSGQETSITVYLNSDGVGQGNWTVPFHSWDIVNFWAVDVETVTRFVSGNGS